MNPVFWIPGVVALLLFVPVVAIVAGGSRVKGVYQCPADEWTAVVKNFGTAFPKSIVVEVSADGETVSGRWRESRYIWIFKDESVAGDVEASMVFRRRWMDGRYRIEIKPDRQSTATVN